MSGYICDVSVAAAAAAPLCGSSLIVDDRGFGFS